MGEKFATNPVTGTGSLTVPIPTSRGRSGVGPDLSLSYDSGTGNGPFGFGWSLSLPCIKRKTEKGLPQYGDASESDVFQLTGAEDLVPVLEPDGSRHQDDASAPGFRIHRYRPRIEGLFSRIERWTDLTTGEIHWRSISRDNVTSLYGRDNGSRVFDPADPVPAHPTRIFSWLLCASYDDKGNAIVYEYASEDGAGVDLAVASERHRDRTAARYLKRILYGNRTSRLVQPGLTQASWLFEVVFDYGEGHFQAAAAAEGAWDVRPDPFSTYRPGFEVRTYRRCFRILMFHRFPELSSGREDGAPYLVCATEFDYADLDGDGLPVDLELAHQGSTRFGSFLRSVTHSGFIRSSAPDGTESEGAQLPVYERKSLPPLELEYSRATIQDAVQSLDAGGAQNLPSGVDGTTYQWADLDGEGLAGFLTEQAGSWFYKPNLGEGRFGPLQVLRTQPSAIGLSSGGTLLDLSGDGRLEAVCFSAPTPGFYNRTQDEGWESFRAFGSVPNLNWDDPNLRFVDLDGDGLAEILITERDVFTWYPSLGEAGFGPPQRVHTAPDEERGPRLVMADGTQSIYLADMSGDGLTDLVRVRNGEVCYWPNLGYGRFGAKVTMDNAPRFDAPDRFDQRWIRLADVDGSGTTDIIYLGRDGTRLYFNQSGNRWSDARRLSNHLPVDQLSSVMVADFLGNGTACLVWSSPLPADARCPLRYVDLLGGQKPNLLTRATNNLGAETRIDYAPSTRFFLADQRSGRPWATRLPFPVHVVEQVTARDHVAGTRFVTRYAYHHGHYDGVEREFRGFAMVEQQDTEAYAHHLEGIRAIGGNQEQAPELHQPPVTLRSWFHTGAYLSDGPLLERLQAEYYSQRRHLPEPSLPPDMTEQESREAARALKGALLRQEVYCFDGSAQESHPYSVIERTYEVRRVQPLAGQRHAIFFTYDSQAVTYYYERDPDDPRIEHTLNLEVGPCGNIIRSARVAYGRSKVAPDLPAEVTRDQRHLYVTLDESDYTPDIDRVGPAPAYRLRKPCEARSSELTGVAPAGALFTLTELRDGIAAAAQIPYEVVASGAAPQRRLLAQTRTLFRDDGLAPLPLGQWDTLGLSYQRYRLAFTPGVVTAHYAGRVSGVDFIAAGYVHLDADDRWWIPSGTAIYPADPVAHFFQPVGVRDALGLETVATLDRYDLLPERTRVVQAPWNEVHAVNDYRVLGPVMLTDPNQNRAAVEIDALGMVVRSALMGKAGAGEGDTLAAPTVLMEYELFNWMRRGQPNFVHVLARERHGVENTRWQESFVYSNGGGGVAMVKARAHPGKALRAGPDGTVSEVDADPRWLGSGRTVLNNKGKPVKQYEPFFSPTSGYETEEALWLIGSTAIHYYDPIGRNVRSDLPNGTFSRVELKPWVKRTFDVNDTVLESRWYAERGSPDPLQPEPANDPERRAAWLAAKHANTPSVSHLDSLGNVLYAVSDHGNGVVSAVRSEADLTGRYSKVYDQLGRQVAGGFKGMVGTPIYAASAEKGDRWTFINVLGATVLTWDDRGRAFRSELDVMHRLLSTFVREPGQDEVLFGHIVYGDRHPEAVQRNLLGLAHQAFDQAGVSCLQNADFKGNPLEVERALARQYRATPDWSALARQPDYGSIQAAAGPLLEAEKYTTRTAYDGLNRPTEVRLPGGAIMYATYNEAGVLQTLRAQLQPGAPVSDLLKGQDHDAKGQRQFAHYGNDTVVRYAYDPATYRLTDLVTFESGDDPAGGFQNIHYTYDPVGNVTQASDSAQQTYFFRNAVVKAENRFEYDALYQLSRAAGRELAGVVHGDPPDSSDVAAAPLPHVNDEQAVCNYTERYSYDVAGNLLEMRHSTAEPSRSWTRQYHYLYQDDPADATNRLASTGRPGGPDVTYSYDGSGNMIRLRSLTPGELTWGFQDELRRVDLGGGGAAYYTYGTGGQRVRKVIERNGALRIERIYLGALEIYREREGDGPPGLERLTFHISDDAGRIAQVDIKTRDDAAADPANPLGLALVRYQHTNHLGSAVLETDGDGRVISYEEYHPFGTTSYRSSKPGVDLSLKRYRFAGRERDDETGLYYQGARYYAPWLGRWISTDPAGFVDGLCLYQYCRNNPVRRVDPGGTDSTPAYLGGSRQMHLTPQSTVADRAAFAEAHGYRMVDPHPEQQRWVGTPQRGSWEMSPEGHFEPIPHETITFEPEDVPVIIGRRPAATEAAATPQSAAGAGEPAAASEGSGPGSSTTVNRIIGGLQLVGGLVEGALAIGMLLAPEPTMATKVGGVVLGAHSLDTLVAGARTLWTGQVAHTMTHEAGAGVARAAGASERTAGWVGTGADVLAGAGPSIGVGISRRLAATAAENLAQGARASTMEVFEGAGVAVRPYTPAGEIIAQETASTCVAASCRMIASDVGVSLAEQPVAAALQTGETGASVLRAAGVLEEVGVTGGQAMQAATLAELEGALASGRSAIVGMNIPGMSRHAFVVDRIADGMVFIRDPLPVAQGSSFAVPLGEFMSFWSRRAVLFR